MSTYPPDLEAFVQQKLSSGEFATRDDVLVEAVRVYREMESRHQQLKADVQAAIDEINRDETSPLDIDSIKSKLVAQWDARDQSGS